MTLAELLVAGVITTSSCCASLQVWGQAAQAGSAARRLVDTAALLDRHWLASQRWIASQAVPCGLAADQLDQALAVALPLAAGLERAVESDGESSGVWLLLRHPSSGLQRRQLFTPSGLGAGLGGCLEHAEPGQELQP